MGILGNLFNTVFTFFKVAFENIMFFIKGFFQNLLSALFEFLKFLLKPIFIIIAFLFYFIYKLGYVIVLLFQVLLGIGKIILSLVAGIFKTLTGFYFISGTDPAGSSWGSIFGNISQHGLSFFQLDIIAYILMFLIWFTGAFAAFRILSSIRGGGDS